MRHWWQTMGMATLSAGAYAVGYGAIVVAAVGGQITLGDFAFLYAALNQMQGGIGALVSLISGLFEDNLYFGTLFELQAVEDTLPVAPTGAGRRVAAPLRSGIELRNVSFTYDRAAKPVLEDVSFTVAPGQVVALVGENGAGKSTLVKLLTRLYDPTGGQVLVDGSDLREYDLEDWRRRVGVVFQDFKRYTMPVRENIGLGNLTQIEDTDAVRAAALRAGADSLVERLPDGYETMLGRRFRSIGNDGVDLSGGEWQRIALARAFMRAPEAGPEVGPGATGTNGANGANGRHDGLDGGAQLLILDEPTSALDARAEHEVYLRFKELTRGRATLLISHRFSTVRMADHILVLDGGRIVEQGSHEALVELDGMYARLYAMQAERYA
ncbi:MAG: Efflux ABC transporter, permease/ATP-binding protein [uncultured Chloroflexi bacterium]|uniref:Efflux ABC transporter, permease/ATP-binding protein n=1 Tax=uncultured Chloroflexota bacterium TaxID=166587 RepID=A0A6J4IGN9_9CHLR|nr:MAG: Efflux ABC transporter, permease/ATP-binding protein [uncultured Chloroflexota bacterium]